ncbi:hypothetical protein MaudCBS49596_007899 [Microsporum audouinii]
MEDPIKLNTAILNTLMDHKYHVTIKLKTIIKRLKPAIDKNSIYLSDDQLQKYGISRSRMDLEKGGRFFKPLSQPYFGSLARHEEFYEVGEWEADPDEVDDAKHICWRLEQLIQSEIPDSPKDRFGIPQAFYEYTSWGPTFLKRSLYGGHWGRRELGREPTDWRFERGYDRQMRGTYLEPHVISFSAHGLYPDESTDSKITRSEILVAADIMRYRLKMNIFITNDIYPILMVSCFNRQVRMNEVYFENETLHFNCTPFIDLSTFERPKLDLYARWGLSDPVGQTSRYPKIKPSANTIINYFNEELYRKKQKSKSRSDLPEAPVLKRIQELRGK